MLHLLYEYLIRMSKSFLHDMNKSSYDGPHSSNRQKGVEEEQDGGACIGKVRQLLQTI